MKYLMFLILLIGCDKDDVCKSFDSVVGLAAGAVASEFSCNQDKVLASLQEAAGKIPYCQEKGVQISGINSDDLKCSLVPLLAVNISSEVTKQWECKDFSSVEDMLKKALKCE